MTHLTLSALVQQARAEITLVPYRGGAQVLGYTPWKQRRQMVAQIGAVFGQRVSQVVGQRNLSDAGHGLKAAGKSASMRGAGLARV